MKTARSLFTIVVFGTLMLGPGYADEPSKHFSEQTPREKQSADARPAERGPAPEKSSLAGPIHAQPKPASGSEFHPLALKKTVPAANEGLLKIKTASHPAQTARLPVGGGTIAPRPGFALTRSSTTVASLGGLAPAGVKHSAAMLNGAAIKPKP